MKIKDIKALIALLPDNARFVECDSVGDGTFVSEEQLVIDAGRLMFIPFHVKDAPCVKDLQTEIRNKKK